MAVVVTIEAPEYVPVLKSILVGEPPVLLPLTTKKVAAAGANIAVEGIRAGVENGIVNTQPVVE